MASMRFLSPAAVLCALMASLAGPLSADDAAARLDAVLDAQDDAVKARYVWRHPGETLEFFGIQPGMTVIEGWPGGGWYTKILMNYLGSEGQVIGASYAWDMLPRFGFYSDEKLEELKTWDADWPVEATTWGSEGAAPVSAFFFGSMPEKLKGTVDAVLMIRALHNLNRFEAEAQYLTRALKDIHDALRPGGILGIVQHQAPEDSSDEWASGSNGYLKKSFVIERLEAAGFELVGESDVNRNPKDQPTSEDFVWRLPPSLATSRDNPELQASMEAIGESDRMTLKFRKP